MEETLYTLLTDIDARNPEVVEQHLVEQISPAAPWFD